MPDRYGDDPNDDPHDPIHDCTNGWRGEDADGNPIPCIDCKPHLAPDKRRAKIHGPFGETA